MSLELKWPWKIPQNFLTQAVLTEIWINRNQQTSPYTIYKKQVNYNILRYVSKINIRWKKEKSIIYDSFIQRIYLFPLKIKFTHVNVNYIKKEKC